MSSKKYPSVDLNFLDVIKTFNKLNLPYWCMHGTLLGLVREHDLIPWDDDIDLAFEFGSVDINLIINELEKLNFIGGVNRRRRPGLPILKYNRSNGRKVEISFFKPKKIESVYTACFEYHKTANPKVRESLSKERLLCLKFLNQLGRLPIHEKQLGIQFIKLKKSFLYRLIGWIARLFPSIITLISRLLSWKGSLNSVMGYYVPISMFGDGAYLNYHGEKCRIPQHFEAVCETLYGKNWHQPIKSISWFEFHKG